LPAARTEELLVGKKTSIRRDCDPKLTAYSLTLLPVGKKTSIRRDCDTLFIIVFICCSVGKKTSIRRDCDSHNPCQSSLGCSRKEDLN